MSKLPSSDSKAPVSTMHIQQSAAHNSGQNQGIVDDAPSHAKGRHELHNSKSHSALHEAPLHQPSPPPLSSHQHPQHSDIPLHGPESIKTNWKAMIGAAKSAWHLLNEAELLSTDGRASKLTHMIEVRYGIPTEIAAKQVKVFLAEHQHEHM